MLTETLTGVIIPRLGNLKSTRKGWQTKNCMLCTSRGHSQDKKGRFGIRFESGSCIAMHCFNCGFKAKFTEGSSMSDDFAWFMTTIGVPSDDVKKLKFASHKQKFDAKVVSELNLTEDFRKKWKEAELPKDAQTIAFWAMHGCNDRDFINVAEYCIKRMMNPNNIMWSPDKMNSMNKRLIMPFVYKGKVVGYTGRHYVNAPPKNIKRYINMTPENFVYNLDVITEKTEIIVLAEGVIDAYLINGISCAGTLNKEQVEIINSYHKRVIVIPDRDPSGAPLIDTALDNDWEVSFPKWDSNMKDVGNAVLKYGKILTLKSILEGAERNPLKINMKRRTDSYHE